MILNLDETNLTNVYNYFVKCKHLENQRIYIFERYKFCKNI